MAKATSSTMNAVASVKSASKASKGFTAVKVDVKAIRAQHANITTMLAKDGLSMAGIASNPVRGSMQYVGFTGWANSADALTKAHAVLQAFGLPAETRNSDYGWSQYCAADHTKRNKSLGKLARYYACQCSGLTTGKGKAGEHKLMPLTPQAAKAAALVLGSKAPAATTAKATAGKARIEKEIASKRGSAVIVKRESPKQAARSEQYNAWVKQFGPAQAAQLQAHADEKAARKQRKQAHMQPAQSITADTQAAALESVNTAE